jgi:predicted nucleic acid-binding protein
MIILDTNVLSALMRKAPEAPVVAWLIANRPSPFGSRNTTG